MYVRNVDDKNLNFAVSGKLWKNSLVMIDEETGSLWSQILGKCMEGDLKDTNLELIPSVITDWSSWKKLHPDTTAMVWKQPEGFPLRYDVSFYQSANTQPLVIGLASAKAAKSYAFRALQEAQLVNDSIGKLPIVLWFDKATGAAWCFNRELDGKLLDFKLVDGVTIDVDTQSQWDLRLGVATSGELAGKKLDPLPAIPSYAKAWNQFYPNNEQWESQVADSE